MKIYAGTIGWGVWASNDLGDSWDFAFASSYMENRIWALSAHPAEPGITWAGSDRGLLREGPDGKAEHVPSPADALPTPGKGGPAATCIWSIAQAPDNPRTLIIGTNPAALYRSDDGGGSWRELRTTLAATCPFIGRPRVTRIRFDPIDADTLWCSVEIDGVHRSTDGGATWQKFADDFRFPDIHDLVVLNRSGQRILLAATAVGLYESLDDGASWQWRKLDSPWQYCRGIKARADGSGTVFLCNGDGPPGSTGRLLRSRDWGQTWEDVNLGKLNSTPWVVAVDGQAPELLFACTNLGQLFRSRDGGERWTKLARELGEVRALQLVAA